MSRTIQLSVAVLALAICNPVQATQILKFAADSGVTTAGGVGTDVTQWNDLAPANGSDHAVGDSDGNLPSLVTVSINGNSKPAISFEKMNKEHLVAAEPIPEAQGSLFLVMRGALGNSAGRVVGWEDACCGAGGLGVGANIGGHLFAIIRDPGNFDVKNSPPLSGNNFETVAVTWGPAGSMMYRNGAVVAGPTGPSSVFGLGKDLRIGSDAGGINPDRSPSDYFNGEILEFQAYDTQLDSAGVGAVNAELGRWFVPEPSSALLLSLGGLALLRHRRRRPIA